MFRSVSVRLCRTVALEDVHKIGQVRSMAFAPPRPSPGKGTILDVVLQIKPRGYAILTFPLVTFALGVWQIKRSMWKANIIEELEARVRKTPIPFPDSLDEVSTKEYYPVKVRGQFDHSREILLGPRTLLNSKKPASTLLSDGSNAGFFVLTPLKLADRDYSIWVNRGWVPIGLKDPKKRQGGQIEGEVEFTGLIRNTEKKPQYVLANDPSREMWLYRDLELMSAARGEDIAPISIDATEDSSLPDGPIGGQTLINLRNTHYSYAFTWLSLSLLSGIIWWQNYVPTVARKIR